jgi:hypothetical protein
VRGKLTLLIQQLWPMANNMRDMQALLLTADSTSDTLLAQMSACSCPSNWVDGLLYRYLC